MPSRPIAATFALMVLALVSVTSAQAEPLRLARSLVAGSRYQLVWEERACDDPAGAVVRSLEATLTLTTVDRSGRPEVVTVEVIAAADTGPVAPPGSRLEVRLLPPRLARSGHSDWGGALGTDPAVLVTQAHLTTLLMPLLFPSEADRAWGTGRRRRVGESWSHRGIERREGVPMHRYRLPGTARVEAREELDGVPVTHVTIEGAAAAPVPLWEGAYTSYAEDVRETVELWVPDDDARPFARVRARRARTVTSTTTETTRTTSAWCDEIRVTIAE